MIVNLEREEQSPSPTIGNIICVLKSITTKIVNVSDGISGKNVSSLTTTILSAMEKDTKRYDNISTQIHWYGRKISFMIIARANENDLLNLLQLYTQLHNNPIPEVNESLLTIWNNILADKNHYILVGKINNEIVASCVLIIVPNLTHGQFSYALIENVITDENYRNKGYATKILDHARDIAKENKCYKIMLMTGSKKESTLNFYRKAGYNSEDKTAFIQWL